MIAVGKVERGVTSSRVGLISILEGGERQPEGPISLSIVDEHSEVVLDLLVDPFGLSVCLWMMHGAQGSLDVELFVEIFDERGHKDRSAVRNDLPRDAVHTDDVLDEQVSPSFRV